MTPTKKGKTTVIAIEKKKRALIDQSKVAHQGGGQHSGMVINKQAAGNGMSSFNFETNYFD